MRRQRGDVVALEQDAAGVGSQHAGQKVDHRGLAGAVRADQGVAGAALDLQRQVARRGQSAERLDQPLRFQRERHGDFFPAAVVAAPLRASNTRLDAVRPPHDPALQALAADQHQDDQDQADPELPVLRRPGRQHVLQQLEGDRADQPAIEIAGAADHQHQQQVGGAVEREHVERGQRRRLGREPAGDAGIERRDGVDRDQPAVDRNADRSRPQRIVADRAQRQAERRMHDAPRQQEHHEQHDQAVDEAGLAEQVERGTARAPAP